MGVRRAIVLLVSAATCAAGCGALVSLDEYELAPSLDAEAGVDGNVGPADGQRSDAPSDSPSDAPSDSVVIVPDSGDPRPCPTCEVLVRNLTVGPEAHIALTSSEVHYSTARPNGGVYTWPKDGGPQTPRLGGDFSYVVADDVFAFSAMWAGTEWRVYKLNTGGYVPLANNQLKGMAIATGSVFLAENASGSDLHTILETTMVYGSLGGGSSPYTTLRECTPTYCYAYADGTVYRAGTPTPLATGQGTVTDIAGDPTYVYWVTPSDVRFRATSDGGAFMVTALVNGVRRIAFDGINAYFLSPQGLQRSAAGSQASSQMVGGTDFYALAVDNTWVYVLSSTALWRVRK